jgi:hypothetical protein
MNLLRQLKDGRCDEFPGGMSTELILISHVYILRKPLLPSLICRARFLRATLVCLASTCTSISPAMLSLPSICRARFLRAALACLASCV